MPHEFHRTHFALTVQATPMQVAAIHRSGPREPIVFLHGFGSTKEDYADIVRHAAFDGRRGDGMRKFAENFDSVFSRDGARAD